MCVYIYIFERSSSFCFSCTVLTFAREYIHVWGIIFLKLIAHKGVGEKALFPLVHIISQRSKQEAETKLDRKGFKDKEFHAYKIAERLDEWALDWHSMSNSFTTPQTHLQGSELCHYQK